MNQWRPFALAAVLMTPASLPAQPAALSAAEKQKHIDTEKELQSVAVVERKVMVPRRDGVRLATNVYRPKDGTGRVPTVFVRTPTTSTSGACRTACPRT